MPKIAEFLRNQKMPEWLDKNEWRKIKIQNHHYVTIANHLYQRELDWLLH